MKPRRLLAAAAALLLLAGCGVMDLTPEGNPARVLVGEIELGDTAALPADATATVRVLDETVIGTPPNVLGAQTLAHLGPPPYAFRVEYRAEDDLLRRGLNIEVRVSYNGRVRFFNRNRYAITYGNAADPHRVHVDPAAP
jgi:uncharacterized lipoprotein YbaY